MKYDLTWGESVCVRQAFVDNIHGGPTVFNSHQLMDFAYPKHEGNEALVKVTREVIKRQTGQIYKHVFLTNGATGAVNMAMRAYGLLGRNFVLTGKPPYFSLYPLMIEAVSMGHITEVKYETCEEYVKLVDSPSNPMGTIGFVKDLAPTIWDAVYHNRIYTDGKRGTIPHNIACGSYSKLTGMNGIRIGWVATNDFILADLLQRLVTAEYCGLSHASTAILMDCLTDLDWDMFETNARFRLDMNRSEWQKVAKFFGGTDVPSTGMFYYTEIDEAAKKLMHRAGVLFQAGSKMGTSDDFARFNLGQDNYLITDAVKAILKSDRR